MVNSKREAADIAGKAALVTGGSRRLGAAIATHLHHAGMDVAIHYHRSEREARALCERLNGERAGSASAWAAQLLDPQQLESMVSAVTEHHGGLHTVINNASSFFPTPVDKATPEQWDDLVGTNLRAPFFVTQQCLPWLRRAHGSVVNMVDIYGSRPLARHPIYCSAKAGLIMLTQAMAQELAPEVRVNAVAPGAILPAAGTAATAEALPATPLGRWGDVDEIAEAVLFLVRDATYTTGATLPVDGGRGWSGL